MDGGLEANDLTFTRIPDPASCQKRRSLAVENDNHRAEEPATETVRSLYVQELSWTSTTKMQSAGRFYILSPALQPTDG